MFLIRLSIIKFVLVSILTKDKDKQILTQWAFKA